MEQTKQRELDTDIGDSYEMVKKQIIQEYLDSVGSNQEEIEVEEIRRYYQLAETLGMMELEFQSLESCAFVEALGRYEVLAEQDYVQAQEKLYHAYRDGIEVPVDLEKALKWLEALIYHSVQVAGDDYYFLGYHYYTGEVLAQSYEKAFPYLQQAAKLHHVEAQFLVGECMLNGWGTEVNPEGAIPYFEEIAGKHKMASTELASCYFHGKGVQQDMLRCIQYLHEENCREVELLLAVAKMYYEGTTIPQNYRKAYLIYRCLWNIGNEEAQYYLGLCYLYGYGVQQNITLALQDYITPQNGKDPEVLYQVGQYYEEGYVSKKVELPISQEKAFAYYYEAAMKGHVEAMYTVGRCYYFHIGVEENQSLAFAFYLQAAEQKYPEALYAVGCCYMQGQGVAEDVGKALEYNEQAAVAGLDIACYTMGEILEQGVWSAPDEKRAFAYYSDAAEKGHQPSLYKLIHCYEHGIGVEKNLVKVFEFSKTLAEDGDISAIYRVGNALKMGWGVAKKPEESIQYFMKGARLRDVKCQLACLDFDYKKYKIRFSWNHMLIYIIYVNKSLQKYWKKIQGVRKLPIGQPIVADAHMQSYTNILYKFAMKIARRRKLVKDRLGNILFRSSGISMRALLPTVQMIEHATTIIAARQKAFAEVKKVLHTLSDSEKELLVMCYALHVAAKYGNIQAQEQYGYLQELTKKFSH